ncbi:MAG TPA: HlyD family efflux transporter periplasmic adaptor subunit, partial [Polyangiaceae bacterium]|nr:HlyD family efflux transporter periplasmic adaptor subunit [Polyangiaceae bacterium]
ELDASRNSMQQAAAEQDAAAQALAELRRGPRSQEIEAGEARLDAARTQVRAAEERIQRHVLYAEGPGEILDVPVKRGEYVAAGTPVVTVADTTRPFVDVFVPQGQIGKFAVGAAVSLKVDTYPEVFAGRVEYISQSTEFTPRFLFSPRERPNLVVRARVRVHDPMRRLRAGIPAFADPEPRLAPELTPPPLGSLLPPPSTSGLPLAPVPEPSAAPSATSSARPAGAR